MSNSVRTLQVLETHEIERHFGHDREDVRGGFMASNQYAWLTNGNSIVLSSKQTGRVESSRSFGKCQRDKSLKITVVQELHKSEKTTNMLLVGCSCKSFGLLFVCQLPTLKTIRCIHIPNPISYIFTINNESLAQDQLCDVLKVMSTVLLIGMTTGAVFAVDLRKYYIEEQLRSNEISVNESKPSKLFIIKKNQDSQEANQISDGSDFHLAMFINENYCNYFKKQGRELNLNTSCLLYIEEINAVAIGYTTGDFQLWDCKVMKTLFVLKKPECDMPVTHITFLEPSDDPNNLCYLWVIQSDNSRLPNAMMIALSYEQRTKKSNGCLSYRVFKRNYIALQMSSRKNKIEIGRCISALTLCNDTSVRNTTGMFEDCEITLFVMLMEIRQNVYAKNESFIFLFDINQWYKAQMPLTINYLEVSNSYASFVKLPDYVSYLDFNISDKTLRPFGFNFLNNVKELYYPSSIYFECNCLLDTKIIRFKHAGVQQEILDQLLLKSWRLLINPSLIFSQCLQTNLKPFFWDKTYDYENYSLLDKLHFVVSIIVENNIMSVFDESAEKLKNGTYSEDLILQLVQCLWNHVMLVKQSADVLCVPLFDCSGTLISKNNEIMLNDCLSQMLRVEHFLHGLQFANGVQKINVDLVNQVKILNLVTQYFNAIIHFFNFELLPTRNEEYSTHQIIQCDFISLIQYASKRRMEFGDLPLYLIDAIVTNEPKGNKLIEQWKHECVEETKGLYPPSNIQCLLRIYLNAELSNRVKNFIIIYFLIDVYSMQGINERIAKMFNDTFVKHEELFKLCCVSWLFDHDMFEDAMLILASNHEWMVNDKSWIWYHWTVLKLFVFKKQYYWAQIYFELFDIELVNLDDHKFYVNLQIMNNQCFDALCHLNLRKIEEKNILFEYIFDRCRHTNQLKAFLNYPLNLEERKLFFSCLEKFEDTESILLMFLVQEKRYSEVIELCKLLKAETNSKHDNTVIIASVLAGKIKDNIHTNNKCDFNKKVFSNKEIKIKFMNCFKDNHNNMKKSNIFRKDSKSCQINLMVPDDDIVNTIIQNEEKVPTLNGVFNPSKIETVKQIEKKLLKLLDTPFIQNINNVPSVANHLSKTIYATDNKQLSTKILDNTPQTLMFGLPDNDDIKVEKFSHEEVISMKKFKLNNRLNITNFLDRDENEKMDTSDSDLFDLYDMRNNELNIEDMRSDIQKCNNHVVQHLSEERIPVSNSLPTNKSSTLEIDNKLLTSYHKVLETTPKSIQIDMEETFNSNNNVLNSLVVNNNCCPIPDIKDNLKSNELLFNHDTTDCLILELNSYVRDQIKKLNNDDNNLILLDSDAIKSDSDLKNLRYCNFKLQKRLDIDAHGDEEIESDNTEIKYVDELNENYSEVPDTILEDKNDSKLKESSVTVNDNMSVQNLKDQPSFLQDCENNGNLEDLDVILDNDTSINNNSKQFSFLPDDENENNLVESDVILISKNDKNVIVTDAILKDDPRVQNNSDGQTVLLDNENKYNLENLDVILDNDASVHNNSNQLSFLLDGENEKNLVESDVILKDDVSVLNNSDKQTVLPDNENEYNLEDPDVMLDDVSDKNSLEEQDVTFKDNTGVQNNLYQLSFLTDNENVNNLVESDVTVHDDVSVPNYLDEQTVLPDNENEYNLEDPVVMLDDVSDKNSLEEQDVTVKDNAGVQNNLYQLSFLTDNENVNNSVESDVTVHDDASVPNYLDEQTVLPDNENEYNLKDPDVMLDDVSDKNSLKEQDVTVKDNAGVQNNLYQLSFLTDNENVNNSVESDVTVHDDVIVPNYLDEQTVLQDNENEYNLEDPDVMLDDVSDKNSLKEQDVTVKDNAGVQNNLYQLSFLTDNENVNNSVESDVTVHDDVSVPNDLDEQTVLPDNENEYNLEDPDVMLDDVSDKNSLKEQDVTVKDNAGVQNNLYQLSFLTDNENVNNSAESDVTVHDDVSVPNDLDEQTVLPDNENEYNLEDPDVMLDDVSDKNSLKELDVTVKDNAGVQNNLYQLSFLTDNENVNLVESDVTVHDDVSVQNNLDEQTVLPDNENEYNLEEQDVTVKDNGGVQNNLYQLSFLTDNENVNNLVESDVTVHDDVSVPNNLDEQTVLPDDENEYNLEELDVTLEGENDEVVEDTGVTVKDNESVQNSSDQLSFLTDNENKNNLLKADVTVRLGYQNNSDQSSFLLDDEYENNLVESDVILIDDVSVPNNSDEQTVLPNNENEYNLEEPDVILQGKNEGVLDASYENSSEEPDVALGDENVEIPNASEQNIIISIEMLKNEKPSKTNDMIDCDNVIYPSESQSIYALENCTPCIYDVTKENRLIDDNQLCHQENTNYFNLVDVDKTSFVTKKNDITEAEENTGGDNKSIVTIHFQNTENHIDDLSNDQNKDNLYEYQYSNNDIFPELSSIAFNPIPEYGFNHLTMTPNELNQFEMYETQNQPTSVMLNESFLNNISLGTTSNITKTQDSVVDNHKEIIIDEISKEAELSSNKNIINLYNNNPNIDTNFYNPEIKSYQVKGIAHQQVDTNIFNSIKREYAVEVQNRYPSTLTEPSKPLIIEELPQNNMLFKDILIQEETIESVIFVKSNSDTESGKMLAKTKEQPFIQQIDKNIPNLRKRSYRTNSISSTDPRLTTRSRSKIKPKKIKLKIISPKTSSPTSEILEDCPVNISKKRLKCQKKNALLKRIRVCPMYVAPTGKIDSKQLYGESSTNKDKNVKEVEKLLSNSLPTKDNNLAFQEKLTKLNMSVKIKPDSENTNQTLNHNCDIGGSHTNNFNNLFSLEPKIILERIDVSLFKNRFKPLVVADDSKKLPLSIKKTKSQQPAVALKKLRSGCLKSIKEPTATNTIIDLEEDSINSDKNNAVNTDSKCSSLYKIKKVEHDKKFKSNSDRLVLTFSKSEPIKHINKIHNSLTKQTIDLISNYESVADEGQEGVGKISPDKDKLDWRIISHEVKTNTNTIPKIRIKRNQNKLYTVSVGSKSDLEANKHNTNIVWDQEQSLMKKSTKSKMVKFNRRISLRKISKRKKCSCCANKLEDVVCGSNIQKSILLEDMPPSDLI